MRALRLFCAAVCLLALPAAAGDKAPRILSVVPLGDVKAAHLEWVGKAIAARADVTVRIEAPVPLPKEAFYAPRKRWRAEKLLDLLDQRAKPDAWKVVGVTAAEISTTKGEIFDWGIAGLGNLGGKSCVVTNYLYRKHHKVRGDVERRLADLAVHEFGHTLGLPHCETDRCVMADAKGKALASADHSSGEFCDVCRSWVTGNALRPPAPDAPKRAPK